MQGYIMVVLIAGLIGCAMGTSDVVLARIIAGAVIGLCIGMCLVDRSQQ